MKELIVTEVVPATDNEPAHTKVWRVEFEGEFADFLDMVDNFATKTKIVEVTQLRAS